MDRNNKTIQLAKKAADAWRSTDTYHQAAQIIDMLISALEGDPTLTPPNDPLTPEQLREMDGEPVYVVSAIGERPEWYIVDIEENEFKNPWDSISLENWDEGYPYTAYRRPPEGEED